MSYNETNSTNATKYFGQYSDFYQTYTYVYNTYTIILCVAGTLLNVWFLVAILRSKEMRSRLRNKIICSSLVLHLVDSAFTLPLIAFMHKITANCNFRTFVSNMYIIQDFIGNWLLVMLIVVFIAQIQDFNPRMKLTPRAVTVGTIGLLVFPWIASLVVVPIILQEFHFRNTGIRGNCFSLTHGSIQIFKSADTATPILLAVILVIVAAVLRYRRFHWGHSSGSMQIELISQGPEIDNVFAYVTAVGVSILCDLLLLITAFYTKLYTYGIQTALAVSLTIYFLSDMRIILMPLTWLLLTDVRQRIKTWRPWYRPAPGIDLTVTYSKEEDN